MQFNVRSERPLAQAFTISRGTKTSADVVVCTVSRDGHTGRGESMPYPRYGESVQQVVAQPEGLRAASSPDWSERTCRSIYRPARATRLTARCGTCEAKSRNQPVCELAGLFRPSPCKRPTQFRSIQQKIWGGQQRPTRNVR